MSTSEPYVDQPARLSEESVPETVKSDEALASDVRVPSLPVWELLEHSYARVGVKPTLLERDFNLPPLKKLLREVEQAKARLGDRLRVVADLQAHVQTKHPTYKADS